MPTPSLAQLSQAVSIAEQIQKLEAELSSIMSGGSSAAASPHAALIPVRNKGKRTMSEATKAKMRAAHQARWAKINQGKAAAVVKPAAAKKAKKGGLTPEGRASLAAKMKARWAARKKGEPALNSPLKAAPAEAKKAKASARKNPWYAK